MRPGQNVPQDTFRAASAAPDKPVNPHISHPVLRHWREAVPHDRLAHLVRDASRSFQKSLHLRLAKHGIAFGHWTFLRILWETDGLTQKELSERAGVMEPTTFAAMKAMETLGYIARKQLPGNRKNVYVYLTAKGRALKRKLVPLAVQTNQLAVQGLSAVDVQTARCVMLAMVENLAHDELTIDQTIHPKKTGIVGKKKPLV